MAYGQRAFLRKDLERGRSAGRPTAIPPRGWGDVLIRVKQEVKRNDVPLLAAGVAFFALLALVPSLVALVSLYGLVPDPADIQRNVDDVLAAAPREVRDLVESQLSSIVDSSPQGLRLGALVGLVVALWSASSGMKHLIAAINRAYDEEETRGFLRLRGLALLLTIGAVLGLLVALAALVVAPNSLSGDGSMRVLRAVVVMLWLYISAYVAIAGAELNAELERQTARDTTTGRPEPMGQRDAYVADTLGESPDR